MTACDRCGKEAGNLFCGKCREEIKGERKQKEPRQMIPVLFYDYKTKMYLPACNVSECPCNVSGMYCSSLITLETFKFICHDYDGDNCVKQVCG